MLFTPLLLGGFTENIPNRSEKEVLYTLLKLSEAGYMKICDNRNEKSGYAIDNLFIYDITYKGHEYLATVKNIRTWEKIKEQLPCFTLSLIEKVGASLITAKLLP